MIIIQIPFTRPNSTAQPGNTAWMTTLLHLFLHVSAQSPSKWFDRPGRSFLEPDQFSRATEDQLYTNEKISGRRNSSDFQTGNALQGAQWAFSHRVHLQMYFALPFPSCLSRCDQNWDVFQEGNQQLWSLTAESTFSLRSICNPNFELSQNYTAYFTTVLLLNGISSIVRF